MYFYQDPWLAPKALVQTALANFMKTWCCLIFAVNILRAPPSKPPATDLQPNHCYCSLCARYHRYRATPPSQVAGQSPQYLLLPLLLPWPMAPAARAAALLMGGCYLLPPTAGGWVLPTATYCYLLPMPGLLQLLLRHSQSWSWLLLLLLCTNHANLLRERFIEKREKTNKC